MPDFNKEPQNPFCVENFQCKYQQKIDAILLNKQDEKEVKYEERK